MDPNRPFEVTIGGIVAPSTLNPWQVEDTHSAELCDQIYETFWRVPDGVEQPRRMLAASDVLEPAGGLRFRIPIAEARFVDGTPVTAADVVDALRRSKEILNLGAVSEAPGAAPAVLFELHEPYHPPDVQQLFAQTFAAVAKLQAGMPIGSGPMMLRDRMRDDALRTADQIHLVPNPAYRGTNHVSKLTFRRFADEQALADALQRKEVDFAPNLQADFVRRIGASGSGLRGDLSTEGSSTLILFFNAEALPRDVRALFRRCVDVRALAKINFGVYSMSHEAKSLVPPFMKPRARAMPPEKAPTLEEATQVLAANGMSGKVTLNVLIPWAPRPYLPKPEETFDALKKAFAAIGITLQKVQPRSQHEYKEHKSGEIHLTLGGWSADSGVKFQYFETHLASYMIPRPGSPNAMANNQSRWDHRETDALLRRFKEDPSSQNEDALNEMIDREAILVPIAWGKLGSITGERLQKIKVTPLGRFYVTDFQLFR